MLVAVFAFQMLFAHPDPTNLDWVAQDPSYREFLTRLQSAVRSGDRKEVARLSGIPLRVNLDAGRYALYRSTREIERDYLFIFTPAVRQAILQQCPEELRGRDQGVTVSLGVIWFDHICLDSKCERLGPVRIEAVNRI